MSKVVRDHASMEDIAGPVSSLATFKILEPRDRSLARAIALTTLRHRNRIHAVLAQLWDRPPPKRAHFLLHALETAVAQILFMNAPESAAVNLAVSAIRDTPQSARFAGFANAVLRAAAARSEELLARTAGVPPFSPWMLRLLSRDFGRKKVEQAGQTICREPAIDLCFRNAGDIANFQKALPVGARSIVLPGNSLRLQADTPVDNLPQYANGSWWVQDAAAAQPVKLLGDISGKHVADLCAAPGGKTLQMAAAGAKVTAVDISQTRLDRLGANLERTWLEADMVRADILQWQPRKKFDAVLLDAPCTATGTVRRHPDILWNKTPDDVTALAQLQKRMIGAACEFLKPGGRLVYANCSLFKDEGENIVADLTDPALRLSPIEPRELPGVEFCINRQATFRSLPHYLPAEPEAMGGMDGFFAARFVRQ